MDIYDIKTISSEKQIRNHQSFYTRNWANFNLYILAL